VATDVGGTREIFPASADAALLVPSQSSSALAAAIHQLLHAPARRRTMGANARRRIDGSFDAEAASRQLMSCYRRAGSGEG
jgi:glycosyltransferase involved in cell wall biosynthesis